MENKLWYIPTMVCYSTIRNKPLINAVIRMNESQKQYTLWKEPETEESKLYFFYLYGVLE